MKAWVVRFVSLYVFNVVVLLLIGLLTPAHVGWAAIWASVSPRRRWRSVKSVTERMRDSSGRCTSQNRPMTIRAVFANMIRCFS